MKKEKAAHLWGVEYSVDAKWWEYWDARRYKRDAIAFMKERQEVFSTLHWRVRKYVRA